MFDSCVCFCCLNYVHCVSSIELLYAALLIWLQLGAIVETLWRGLSENLKRASAWSIVAHYSYKNSCRSYQPNKWVTPFWGKSISLFAPIPIRLDINRDNTSRSQSRLSDGQVFPDTQNRSNLPHFWVKISYFWSLQSSLVSSGPKIVRQNLIYKADEMEEKQFVKFMTGRNPYRNVGLSQQWFINLFSRLFAEDFADPRNPNLEICLWKQQFNMNFFFT